MHYNQLLSGSRKRSAPFVSTFQAVQTRGTDRSDLPVWSAWVLVNRSAGSLLSPTWRTLVLILPSFRFRVQRLVDALSARRQRRLFDRARCCGGEAAADRALGLPPKLNGRETAFTSKPCYPASVRRPAEGSCPDCPCQRSRHSAKPLLAMRRRSRAGRR